MRSAIRFVILPLSSVACRLALGGAAALLSRAARRAFPECILIIRERTHGVKRLKAENGRFSWIFCVATAPEADFTGLWRKNNTVF
jgi:hypothetical protein